MTQVFDQPFYKNKRSIAAKKRAAEQKRLNPDHFAKTGRIGGEVKGVKKGFASNPELARKVGAKGLDSRWGNDEKAK